MEFLMITNSIQHKCYGFNENKRENKKKKITPQMKSIKKMKTRNNSS